MVNKDKLARHYGTDWDYVQMILGELNARGFWAELRKENVSPILDSLNSGQPESDLAAEILTKRTQNAVLWTLETEFKPQN